MMYPEAWARQPNVCRCCMSAKGGLKLTRYEDRLKGTFADAVSKSFGITLSYLSKDEASQFICITCIKLLKNAYNFREQILMAEENYVKFFKMRFGLTDNVIKLEKTEQNDDDNFCEYEFLDVGLGSDDASIAEVPIVNKSEAVLEAGTENPGNNTTSSTALIRPHRGARAYPNLGRSGHTTNTFDTNSAEPVPNNINLTSNSESPPKPAKKKRIRNRNPEPPETDTKKLSERMRVVLTSKVVLPYTTACPFRHLKSWFKCFYCPMEFRQMSSVRAHTNEKHQDVETELKQMKHYPRSLQIDISELECRLCHSNLTDVATMQQHFQTTHNKVLYQESIADFKVDSSPYTCHLCKEMFHVFRSLTTHLNVHYRNCICDVCGRSFMNSKRLKTHKTVHVDGAFPCKECGKVFKNKPSQVNHIESAHAKRQVKCQICLKPMRNYTVRVKHMSEEHNITHVHKCKVCSKEFTIKQYLATHMRYSHGAKTVVCEECGMVFVNNHNLRKHMAKHTGVKPYKCLVCDKSFAKSSTLKAHMSVHESEEVSIAVGDVGSLPTDC